MGAEAVARGRRRTETERDLLAAIVGLGSRRGPRANEGGAARHGPDADLELLCRAALE